MVELLVKFTDLFYYGHAMLLAFILVMNLNVFLIRRPRYVEAIGNSLKHLLWNSAVQNVGGSVPR